MNEFSELIKSNEKTLENKISGANIFELIEYLENCNDKTIKNKIFKVIEKIHGTNYLEQLKVYIIHNNKKLKNKKRCNKMHILYIQFNNFRIFKFFYL